MDFFFQFLALFAAGLLTILLPCILPLLPIVLGVSIAGHSRWRPLLTVLGMVVSFIGFTFLLFVVLAQFVAAADIIRIATFAILFLFGVGFITENKWILRASAIIGALFFWSKGPVVVAITAGVGVIIVTLAPRIAARIQNLGAGIQSSARAELGQENPLTAFIVGLTLGLVWVPCAGPALSFAFTLVRDEPGLRALTLLAAYALGTAVPLLIIGYIGQAAVHSVRTLSHVSGIIKKLSGVLLIVTALALQFDLFIKIQIYLTEHTNFGTIGTDLEEKLFPDLTDSSSSSPPSIIMPSLQKLGRAPEFTGLGTWHNSTPFTMKDLKGKVVLVDFWTYSCINCIRTLPYIEGYWKKFGVRKADGTIDLEKTPFVLIGIHSPEFVFEKSDANVAAALKKYGLTYPVAQDNDFGTWKAFANRYWPAKYLIDANGVIRYEHFGEGDYDETDQAIAALLTEAGHAPSESASSMSDTSNPRGPVSPETYIGVRSWPAFANQQGEPSHDEVTYSAPQTLLLHQYALDGTWQLNPTEEHQTLVSDGGEIRMHFIGGELNLVLGLKDESKPVKAEVFIDNKRVQEITVTMHDLYQIFKGEYGEHEMRLVFKGAGVEAYAFTFGG
jgi:cytochrome c biogenesis protein CcdA/thiol-disulfide isomerase/thioredoxin